MPSRLTKSCFIMKKQNNNKQNVGRFNGLIDQMNRDKYKLVLVRLDLVKDFATECLRRGYDLEVGDIHNDSIVMFRK